MKPAPICYVEIPAPNIEIAGSFYRSIFNWNISPSHLTDQKYWMFGTGDNQLMGGFDSTKTAQGGGVILYIQIDDIPATLKSIEAMGGKVVRGKFEIGEGYGFSAIFEDPNGNHLGLWANN